MDRPAGGISQRAGSAIGRERSPAEISHPPGSAIGRERRGLVTGETAELRRQPGRRTPRPARPISTSRS
ncbi:hypothetical protein FRAAL5286 [Frankia alni ACN14a]|uniref:Uncharacterized protein n=1 Tax=Frankia alni (strain DSM 45986 / CECT 9034 / ACN14a) TaxID=326424 RepID=Q0RF32_FRAAA|nr:hypothetical protein FRAAL5286 [Frankia alni ACN14a]